jgi:hypothetical protein
MNENTPLPSQLSPPSPPANSPPTHGPRAPGDDPEDHHPIRGVAATIEAILRQPGRVIVQLGRSNAAQLIAAMLFTSAVCSLIYGAIVGSFSGHEQRWAAPAKIAGGLLFSTAICVPSLYIFACLSGSKARLIEIVGMVAGLLTLMTILLVGFAPVAWLFSESTSSVAWMGGLHLAFMLIAMVFGLRFLSAAFSHSQARSRTGLNTWIVVFVLVVLQMTTTLRPIVGRAETFMPNEKKFFLTHWVQAMDSSTWEGPARTTPLIVR